MIGCSFERLIRLLDRQLNLEAKLELFDHLDRCETCREAVYQIARDRDRERYAVPVSGAIRTKKPKVAVA